MTIFKLLIDNGWVLASDTGLAKRYERSGRRGSLYVRRDGSVVLTGLYAKLGDFAHEDAKTEHGYPIWYAGRSANNIMTLLTLGAF